MRVSIPALQEQEVLSQFWATPQGIQRFKAQERSILSILAGMQVDARQAIEK